MKQNTNCRDGYSLRENIAAALTVESVNELLAMGRKQLEQASLRTRRAWRATANRRIAALSK